jgi:hypothetical protein
MVVMVVERLDNPLFLIMEQLPLVVHKVTVVVVEFLRLALNSGVF